MDWAVFASAIWALLGLTPHARNFPVLSIIQAWSLPDAISFTPLYPAVFISEVGSGILDIGDFKNFRSP